MCTDGSLNVKPAKGGTVERNLNTLVFAGAALLTALLVGAFVLTLIHRVTESLTF